MTTAGNTHPILIPRGYGEPDEIFDVFQVGVDRGTYLSEDYWVCAKLIELGFNLYVDLGIRTRHSGMASFQA